MKTVFIFIWLSFFSSIILGANAVNAPAAAPNGITPILGKNLKSYLPRKISELHRPIDSPTSLRAISIGTMLQSKLNTNYTAYNGPNVEGGSFQHSVSGGLQLSLEWSDFQYQSWNHGFAVGYSISKLNTFLTQNSSGTNVNSNAQGDLTMYSLDYAGKYRFEEVYVPIYFGYVHSTIDSTDLFARTLKAKSRIAYGLGFVLHNKFFLELIASSVSMSADPITINGTTYGPETTYLSGVHVTGKILF